MSPGVSGGRQLHEGGVSSALRVVQQKCRTERHFAGAVRTGPCGDVTRGNVTRRGHAVRHAFSRRTPEVRTSHARSPRTFARACTHIVSKLKASPRPAIPNSRFFPGLRQLSRLLRMSDGQQPMRPSCKAPPASLSSTTGASPRLTLMAALVLLPFACPGYLRVFVSSPRPHSARPTRPFWRRKLASFTAASS